MAPVEPPPAPVAAAPEAAVRKPDQRAPMPVELARMLEEETWWRVVPAEVAQAPVRAARKVSRSTEARTPVLHGRSMWVQSWASRR